VKDLLINVSDIRIWISVCTSSTQNFEKGMMWSKKGWKMMIRLRGEISPNTLHFSKIFRSLAPIDIYLPVMAIRKVWVKRAHASATQVAIGPDDLVDDVRDAVIRKYLNSLGRTFDAPDVSLKISPREQTNKAGNERLLAPDEPIIRLIDAYYPGGQTVEEALIIDVPQRRTPKPSPWAGPHMPSYFIPEEIRPGEAGEYFPPMPALQSPHLNPHGALPTSHPANSHLHSMAILTTGQLPTVPSPGGRSGRLRPKAGRQHTSSPTILHSVSTNSNLLGMY
jgi:osomolarity two-component system, response regulator SSK1